MNQQDYVEMLQAVAQYLNVDEDDIMESCERDTVTVGDSCYLVWKLEEEVPPYKYCMIPVL